jgi:hypothetical protein
MVSELQEPRPISLHDYASRPNPCRDNAHATADRRIAQSTPFGFLQVFYSTNMATLRPEDMMTTELRV